MIRRALGAILSALAAFVALVWAMGRAERRGADRAGFEAARTDLELASEIRGEADELRKRFEAERGGMSGDDLDRRLQQARDRMARR